MVQSDPDLKALCVTDTSGLFEIHQGDYVQDKVHEVLRQYINLTG